MLHLKTIVLMRGIQLNKNFSNLSNPVLTTTQNDTKIAHFFDSNSLVILSTHKGTCTDEVNVSEQESYKIGMRTCSKTLKILDYS